MSEARGRRQTLRRWTLLVTLASLAVSAVIGCYVVIVGEFEETEARLLSTSLTVFGTSALALVCAAAWERGRLGFVPPAGIAFVLVAFAMTLVAIWEGADLENESYWKALGTISTPAVAAAHASFVAMFVLTARYRLAPVVAYAMNTMVTTLAVLAIWWEAVSDNEPLGRLSGTLVVLLIATTIALPVLRRLERPDDDAEPAEYWARFCPHCGEGLDPPGASDCPTCGASFQVELTTP